MNNPFEIIKNAMNNGNISYALNKFIGNNNPIIKDLVSKAEKGDSQSVENFARNLLKEQGRDFDKEFSQFMKNFR